jgi:hypothetical protein
VHLIFLQEKKNCHPDVSKKPTLLSFILSVLCRRKH